MPNRHHQPRERMEANQQIVGRKSLQRIICNMMKARKTLPRLREMNCNPHDRKFLNRHKNILFILLVFFYFVHNLSLYIQHFPIIISQKAESCSNPSQPLLRISCWTRETFTFKSSPLLIWNPVRISHKLCPSSRSMLASGKLIKKPPLTATLNSLSVNANAILNCWLTSNGNSLERTSESPQLSLKSTNIEKRERKKSMRIKLDSR